MISSVPKLQQFRICVKPLYSTEHIYKGAKYQSPAKLTEWVEFCYLTKHRRAVTFASPAKVELRRSFAVFQHH